MKEIVMLRCSTDRCSINVHVSFPFSSAASFQSGAEEQLVIMLQDEFPYIAISGLSTKGDLADCQLSRICTLKDAYPERVFKEYRQA